MARRPARRALVASGAVLTVGVLGLAAASPALSAEGDAQTVVRQSVQTLLDASGEVKASRVYTQVQSSGNGDVSFVETLSGSLRNLNGFGQPATTAGDQATWNYTVDGLSNQRTLQDFPAGELPITVTVSATLDGQPIEVADIVGRSGLLKMTYEIENTTGTEQEISWTDGAGQTQTKRVLIPLPYVGSMDTTLPDSYAEINAPGASVGGTGRNSTQLSYTLLLYPPLGDTKATISYEARVTDAEVPEVAFTFLPTPPSGNPTTKSALDQYLGGQQTGAELTDGATQIDTNLLKLAAGAGQLNEGLAQLLDGANQLSAGLAPAAAGSQELADGLDGAVDGSQQIADGAEQASSGADQLADGSAQVADGNAALAAGLADLQDGIAQLYSAADNLSSIVGSDPAFQQLKGALASVQAAIGSPNDPITKSPATATSGINKMLFGLDNPACDKADPENAGNPCGFKQVLELLQTKLDNNSPSSPGAKQALTNILGVLGTTPANPSLPLGGFVTATSNLFASLGCAPDAGSPTGGFCSGVAVPADSALTYATLGFYLSALGSTGTPGNTVLYGLDSIKNEIGDTSTPGTALYAINGLIEGIGSPSDFPAASGSTLYYGLLALRFGLTNPACNPANPTSPSNPCGIKEIQGLVSAGIDELVQGISDQFTAAIGQPTKGCDPTATLACATAALSAGANQLVDGADQVADGNADLADGLTALSAGADQLAAGLPEAQAGAQQLADGLPSAADGAGQIADGLDQAVPGGTQIEDGANQLSTEGTKALIQAGQDTTNSFGERAATMQAIDAAAESGAGLPNGEAEGLDGSEVTTTGVFGYFLDGVSQSQSQNGLRFLLAGLLLAGAVGAGALLARR